MELIDTHAHLYENVFTADIDMVIAQIQQAGVTKVIMPNIDHTTLAPLIALTDRYPSLCMPMIGLHPCYVKKGFASALYILETWLEKRKFVAIGEIGIDLYHDTTYQELQEEVFIIQLEWAKKYQLPIVIHSRAASAITLQLIERNQDGALRGIFHCFNGTMEEARKIIALGFHVGIGGLITFKNASLGNVVAKLDLANLVIETDSPYLAPVPYRGKRNNPSYLPYIVTALANNKQTTGLAVASATTANAKKIFGIL
jgi:TatD DNase family protein